jgi:ribosomal-protein-serine acetyltransferase
MPAIFRRATVSDISAMSQIRLSVTENALSDPSRVTTQMYEDYLEKDGRGWVAEVDGLIVAFSYADKHDASIWALFVNPGHEGRGMATELLKLATGWLFGLGHPRVTLSTSRDTRADRFYAGQGWRRGAANGRNVEYELERPDPAAGDALFRPTPLMTEFGIAILPTATDHAEALASLVLRDREHLHTYLPLVATLSSVEAAMAHLTAATARAASAEVFEWLLFDHEVLCGSVRLKDIDQDNRKAQIGYFLGSEFGGRGIMTSAVHAVLTYCFSSLNLNRIELRCAAGNAPSIRVAERVGFVREGVLRQEQCLNGVFVDHCVYGLLRADFKGSPPLAR